MSTDDEMTALCATIERWFSEPGTIVPVFENRDLSSPDIGRRVAIPYHATSESVLRDTGRAPDIVAGVRLGWRYRLLAIARAPDECLALLERGVDHTGALAPGAEPSP